MVGQQIRPNTYVEQPSKINHLDVRNFLWKCAICQRNPLGRLHTFTVNCVHPSDCFCLMAPHKYYFVLGITDVNILEVRHWWIFDILEQFFFSRSLVILVYRLNNISAFYVGLLETAYFTSKPTILTQTQIHMKYKKESKKFHCFHSSVNICVCLYVCVIATADIICLMDLKFRHSTLLVTLQTPFLFFP